MTKNIPLLPIVNKESVHRFCRQTDGTPYVRTLTIADPLNPASFVHVNSGYLRTNQYHDLLKLSSSEALLNKGIITSHDYLHDPIHLGTLVLGTRDGVVHRVHMLENNETNRFKTPSSADNPNTTCTRVLKMRYDFVENDKPVYVQISAEVNLDILGGINVITIANGLEGTDLDVIGFSLSAERHRFDPNDQPWMRSKGPNPIKLEDITMPKQALDFLRHEVFDPRQVDAVKLAMDGWIDQQEAEGRRDFAVLGDVDSNFIIDGQRRSINMIRLNVRAAPASLTRVGLDILVINHKFHLYYTLDGTRRMNPFVVL